MPYLCCKDCGDCYQLKPGESPQDYGICHCGGEIYYTEHLPTDFYEKEYNKMGSVKSRQHKRLIIILSPLLILMVLGASMLSVFIPLNLTGNDPTLIGSDYRGEVTKMVYPSNTSASRVVVVVTGIHPREKLSIQVSDDLVKKYPLASDQQIIHYKIKVKDHPEIFSKGRSNGEALAAQYIMPDIKKSKADVVIVFHDHEPGYGEGYFIATPAMDVSSVSLAENISQTLGDFNYYKSNVNSLQGTSAITFSNPIAKAGYRSLVYEIPGLDTYQRAYNQSKRLLDSAFRLI